MSIIKRVKNFYHLSAENRAQFFLIFGFILLPIAGMLLLYLWVSLFLLVK